MEISITIDQLNDVLREAKKQFASLCLNNEAGISSEVYFDIDDIMEIKTSAGDMTILIMHSDIDARCHVMDVRLISRMRFNKYLNYKGFLADKIKVGRINDVLELTYSSNNTHNQKNQYSPGLF